MSKHDLKLIIQRMKLYSENSVEPEENSIRKASVAAIIRWRPYLDFPLVDSQIKNPLDLLIQPWVNDCHGEAEILYIQRALRPNDVWSGHIAFPGGKDEPSDKTSLDTVIRECREEIGIDLSTDGFLLLGTLEKRKINQANMLKMILTPYVFLQVTPITPACTIQISEVADLHWIPIRYLLNCSLVPYTPIKEEDPTGKSPWSVHTIVPAIPIADVYLWGMTLRMTQDILQLPISPYTLSTSHL